MYIGVDGGGTRARGVLVDGAGAVLRRAEGPAGLVDARDPSTSVRVLTALAAELAGGERIDVLCCGLAGAGRRAEREAVRQGLLDAGAAAAVIVASDAEVALEDAFPAGPGVLIIAGTGSIAFARDRDGVTHRVGGWGQLLGDEGSGYAIGLAGLRAVTRAADGRAGPTTLTGALLSATGGGEPEDLIAYAAAASKGIIASLAPVVLERAGTDATAARLRDEAVAALVELGRAAARRAALDTPAIALTGGLLAAGGPLREPAVAALREAWRAARISAAPVDGARGAAARARRAGGS